MEKIRLGISSCLIGENVRYDGDHCRDRFLTDTLGKYVEYVPVCPEVGLGLTVPREPIQLEGNPEYPCLMTKHTRQDITDPMLDWAREKIAELEKANLCGFIFKSKSPSCGIERVKIHREKGAPIRKGSGLFAHAFMERFPLTPVEEEDRLNEPVMRDNFIERIFVLKRWRDLLKEKKNLGNLVDFHARHKLLILSHSTRHYQLTGRIVAKAKDIPMKELYRQYQTLLIDALRINSTAKKNANVLMHIMGYFKQELSTDEKRELLEMIDNYRTGFLPLIVPVTLLNHYVRKYDQPYLKDQIYLNPHPLELQLRNHV